MLTKMLQGWARGIARRAAQIFVKTPITPNMLTLFGFVLNAVVAVLLATGHLLSGGVMLIAASLFDMLDGALAKITNRVSVFGAFLDSVVDRYSEAAVLFGLLLFYYWQPASQAPLVEIVLLYVILVGSMMISYARARAGALDIANEVGIMARPERIILLAIGLLFHSLLLLPMLWVLAIGTQVTALQRVIYVWQVTTGRRQEKKKAESSTSPRENASSAVASSAETAETEQAARPQQADRQQSRALEYRAPATPKEEREARG